MTEITTEFVRHRKSGKVEIIHRRDCRFVKTMKGPLPWNWAEGRDPWEWLQLGWFCPCNVCCPDLAELRRERFGRSVGRP